MVQSLPVFMKRSLPIIALVLMAIIGGGRTADAKPIHAAVEAAKAFVEAEAFNGVVLIAGDADAPAFTLAHGIANAETNTVATPETAYHIGSISKWFTTLVALRLVDRGELTLDAPLGPWLPALPEETATRVQLVHLLSNASGIPDGVMAAFREDRRIVDLPLSARQAAERYGRGALQWTPGEGWDYALTNWVLVRAILERATGRSFETLIDEEIIRPMGLQHTGVPVRNRLGEAPGVAAAYAALTPEPKRNMPPVPTYAAAAGTLYSTAEDLRRAADIVYEGTFLSSGALQDLSTVRVAEQDYALGGRMRRVAMGAGVPDLRVPWETGAMGGFKTLLAHVPGDGVTIVILNNTDRSQSSLNELAEQLLRAIYAPPAE